MLAFDSAAARGCKPLLATRLLPSLVMLKAAWAAVETGVPVLSDGTQVRAVASLELMLKMPVELSPSQLVWFQPESPAMTPRTQWQGHAFASHSDG